MESPTKKSTSRVIEQLQHEIDKLKSELEGLRESNQLYKKRYDLLSKKNDSLVDQLANAKHENDMIGALLKRKERRIADLEEEFNDVHSSNENLKLANKNLKIRCDNLQESLATSTAEHERLKIAYDALIASQHEYKRHYQQEMDGLYRLFEVYKKELARTIDDLSAKLDSNDKDYDTLLESLTAKRKSMDNINVNKNKAILLLLVSLAKAAKVHGEESKEILLENVDVVSSLKEKYPDLKEKIKEREKINVDIESILLTASESLSTSFGDIDIDGRPSGQSKASLRRRRGNTSSSNNKRNSMRLDSPEPGTTISLPKQRYTLSSGSRNMSSSGNSQSRSGSRSNRNSQIFPNDNNNQHTLNKNKRRLFYGGSSNFNSGGFDSNRKTLRKVSSETAKA